MYLFLSWIYCPSFILNLLTDGNILNVFYDWRCWSSSAGHFWYDVAEVCVYRTKKPVEVQEMLLSLTNQRLISQLKPGNTDSVASTPPVRRRKLSALRSHVALFWLRRLLCGVLLLLASELLGLLGVTGGVVVADRSSWRPMMSSQCQIDG